ncbi:MAG: NAD(P)-binding domain-containing protein [Anaerolineales bacterium]|nr:NAD(P)-binding domain-containing protein [Anaerolineales bacterium]
MKIGFIGLGKLGLPCALAIESRGHEVVGYDTNPQIENYLKLRHVPYKEQGMEVLLKVSNIQLQTPEQMVGECDIIFVAVQTPHDPRFEGSIPIPGDKADFDYSYLQEAMRKLAYVARAKQKEQVTAIISTVLPGTYDGKIRPIIQNEDNWLKIVYNPFFIAMGTVIEDFLFPEFVLLGVDNIKATMIVADFYRSILPKLAPPQEPWMLIDGLIQPGLFTCSIRTAEAIKVLYNTYITQKIVFANAAMELCHKTGADVDDLIDCLSLGTKRIISPMYMRGGMGDGGLCHPRDNIALSYIAQKYVMSYNWWDNLMKARDKQARWIAELCVTNALRTHLDIVVLGKSFKPETDITGGSPSFLVHYFIKEMLPITGSHRKISIWDPHVDRDSQDEPNWTIPAVYLIGTKHKEWPLIVSNVAPGSIVIDPGGISRISKG